MDMETIINDWKGNAEQNESQNFSFLRSLKNRSEKTVDRAARRLHKKAFSIIDCTECANCCKAIHPLLTKADTRRIARHLGMEVSVFKTTYLEVDEDRGLRMKSLPCPFLGPDNRCTIYEVRPADCAEYPHTDKDGFASRTYLHSDNARQCPAVFFIVEQMRTRGLR